MTTRSSDLIPAERPATVSHPDWRVTDDFSLFSVGTIILRNRWRIVRWSLAFGVLAALTVIGKPRVYRAAASFIPQGTDPGRSSLATLAGQFGVAIPSSSQGLTPEFYATLVRAPVLLRGIATDTFTVAEMGGRRVPFLELFDIEGETPTGRLDNAVRALEGMISVSHEKPTGVIALTVTTPWPSVSLAIAQATLDGVNEFNLHTRQSQAGAERRFVEGRLQVAAQELRQAEDRVAQFRASNRQYTSSPGLSFQHERLVREVTIREGVFTSLNQAYEEVRLREVRDTPVITVVEPPLLPTHAQPRGRVIRTVLGLVGGAVIGVILSILGAVVTRRRRLGDTEVDEFMGTLTELRGKTLSRVPFIGSRNR